MTVTLEQPIETVARLQRLALDITRACQAQCTHCYNLSGPSGTAGEMTRENWLSLLDQAADLGVTQLQLIGGEPTLHPNFSEFVVRGVDLGMQVEVFSNLIHVRAALWPVLRQRGVTLATSYYSNVASEHEEITQHRGSYSKTQANIATALRYGIPLRAAIIDVHDGQHAKEADAELRQMGVTHIRVDQVRSIGRAATTDTDTDTPQQITELCGHCAKGRAAVMPSGDVAGCVMSGDLMVAGNVRTTPLAEIITSPEWAALAAAIPAPGRVKACGPDSCQPADEDWCQPGACSPASDSCGPNSSRSTDTRAGCSPDGCTPKEDSCGPSPTAVPVARPALDGSCGPDLHPCGPDDEGPCGAVHAVSSAGHNGT